MLIAENLTKSYASPAGPVQVLNGVSLRVTAGESVALTGESGSGKSTLLHLLGALDTADSGTITLQNARLDGLDETARAEIRRTQIGIVFQQLNLIPSLNVAQNLSFQARLAGRVDTTWHAELSDRLGLSALQHRYPEELSGGQQQRVAIGRAIAARPALLLADEPTGNLDETTADAVMTLLQDLTRQTGTTLLMVTHSRALAARLDRTVHLSKGQLT